MVQVERDFRGTSSPIRFLKQEHLEWAAQDQLHVGFEDRQGRRLHSLFGQPVSALCYAHSKEAFLHVKMETPGFQVALFASNTVAGLHREDSSPSSLHLPLRHTNLIPSQSSTG